MAQQIGQPQVQQAAVAAPQDDRLRPHPKLVTATSVGALVTVAVWLVSLSGVHVPPEVATAVVTVLAGGAGYATPSPSTA
jgi:NaMN:DMB phosphoribosyltransferase